MKTAQWTTVGQDRGLATAQRLVKSVPIRDEDLLGACSRAVIDAAAVNVKTWKIVCGIAADGDPARRAAGG